VQPLIALMMEAARTSETSVNNYFTRQYIPEKKSELQLKVKYVLSLLPFCLHSTKDKSAKKLHVF
jgi:hypothetical protein